MPPNSEGFRERLNTNCTVESRDSGIDVRNRNRDLKKPTSVAARHLTRINNMDDERRWDIDNILWIIAFLIMVWFFQLPVSIWFSSKVDWNYMIISLFSFAMWIASGVWMYLYNGTANWRLLTPSMFYSAWFCYIIGVLSFCHASWPLFGYWSVYIVVVTSMFLYSVSRIMA